MKSPRALARFLESNHKVDWRGLKRALGLAIPEYWIAPCGYDPIDGPCVVDIESIEKPRQEILVVHAREWGQTIEYFRFVQRLGGTWEFAGECFASERNAHGSHKFLTLGGKTFLAISSDHSQIGFAALQMLEEWFASPREALSRSLQLLLTE